MRKTSPQRWQISELLLPISIFLILVWYTYGILFVASYPGFTFTNINGRVATIYSPSEQTPTLQKDDVLVQIGLVTWESYKGDARVLLFEGIQPGEIVQITVNRNGETLTIPWKFSGFDPTEFKTRFLNIWGLAFIFWFFGTVAHLLIRPKDGHQRLFIAANYLTALWLIFGSLSSFQLWGSSILLHAVTWLLLPIYLHLHWVFPRPLKELPKTVWTIIYLIGSTFAAAEILQILPKSLYALAFLTALLGSIVLEGTHYIRQADQRRDVSILATSIFVAFFPAIIFGILVVAGTTPTFAPATLFSMPFMPLAYFYVIYRRQSGGLEVRGIAQKCRRE
ncbi:MAG: hypothetical protein HY863_12850 [Chloroflexi bacterium]|nr:hypothetical protein [Chloroflexota bacterium]